MAETPLTDVQIAELEAQGFVEGDVVPGRGRLTPLGTFEDLESATPVEGEPTVLSTESGERSFATNIQPTIDEANDNLRLFQEREEERARLATETPEVDLDALGLDEDSEKTPEQKLFDRQLQGLEQQQRDAEELYDALTISITKSAQAQIGALRAQWGVRTRMLERSNFVNLKTWQQQFIRSGQAEYSPGISGDFLTAKEQEGIRKLQDLDLQYNSAISQINAALGEKKFAAAATLTSILRNTRKEMDALIEKNFKEAVKINEQVRANDAIYNAFAGGITEVGDVFANLRGLGIEVTLEDVQDVLDVINPDVDKLKGLSADFKTFKTMQESGEISKTWSYFDYLSAVGNAKRKAEGGDDGTTGFDIARQFILDNAGEPIEDMRVELLRRSDELGLNITEINALLSQAELEEKAQISDSQLEVLAIKFVKEEFAPKARFTQSKSQEEIIALEDSKGNAFDKVRSLEKIKVGGETVTLTAEHKKILLNAISNVTVDEL